MKLFKKHRVRATVYHLTALTALAVIILNLTGLLSDKIALYITLTVFILDYVLELYDPNPDAPGPWFKRHFHRAFDDNDEEES